MHQAHRTGARIAVSFKQENEPASAREAGSFFFDLRTVGGGLEPEQSLNKEEGTYNEQDDEEPSANQATLVAGARHLDK